MTSPVSIHGTFLWSQSASLAYTMASSKHHHDSGLGLGGDCTNCGPKLSRAGFSPSGTQTSTADARIFKFIGFPGSRSALKRTTACSATYSKVRYHPDKSRVIVRKHLYPKRRPSVSYRTSFRGWITTDRQIAWARTDGGQGTSIIPASHYKCSGCNPGNRPDMRRGEVFASRT
jgi:hypothetical protein